MLAQEFFEVIRCDLKRVETELKKIVVTSNPLLTETNRHLLLAGGKRLRPAFALLSSRLFGGELKDILPLAVALEMVHMATLVHDDVVDNSMTRRGEPTVKAKWGDCISLHTGDYLFAKALILISDYDDKRIPKILADVSVRMCEGEIQQLATAYNTEQDVRDYFYRIKRKTALLISASTELGAIVADASQKDIRALKYFGHYLGMAFQIIDDILDMVADEAVLGKEVGSDLRQGILTLPAIYTMYNPKYRDSFKNVFKKRDKDEADILKCIEIITSAGGIKYSSQIARKFVDKAKKELSITPHNKYREALEQMADFIYYRTY